MNTTFQVDSLVKIGMFFRIVLAFLIISKYVYLHLGFIKGFPES